MILLIWTMQCYEENARLVKSVYLFSIVCTYLWEILAMSLYKPQDTSKLPLAANQ